eukprot:SAG31_NODE_351_length_17237_cov_7.010445_4_plen_63_part_00
MGELVVLQCRPARKADQKRRVSAELDSSMADSAVRDGVVEVLHRRVCFVGRIVARTDGDGRS